MDFYEALSLHYDEIFAVSAEEMSFIASRIPQGARVLDLGCGTGDKTVHFSGKAAAIEAVDLDEGMIAAARRDHARPNIRYAAMDMLGIDQAFAGRSFDAVLCLGNTLVHLPSPDAIRDLLRKARRLLAENGALILQILNYDRILAQNVAELPALEGPNVRFTRRYARQGEMLRFITEIEVKESGERLRNDIPLYPLRKAELAACLAGAGFARTDFYGSFQGGPHQADSFLTMAVCG